MINLSKIIIYSGQITLSFINLLLIFDEKMSKKIKFDYEQIIFDREKSKKLNLLNVFESISTIELNVLNDLA